MSYLTHYFVECGCDVSLITLADPKEEQFYLLDPSIKQYRLGLLGGRYNWWRLVRTLKRFIAIRKVIATEEPDVVISFMDTMNITVLLSTMGLNQSVVVSERVDPALHQLGRLRHMLRLVSYPLANEIVVQTNKIKNYFPKFLHNKIKIIPNAVPSVALRAEPEAAINSRYRIVAVGRLHRQKGFDLLITAFSNIADRYPDWNIAIFGEGPEREELEGRIKSKGLEDRIKLLGVTKDIIYELSVSHIMAFPSRYEGFPNALAEGLATGLPCVAFRDVSGVEELIIDGETGIIVDSNPEADSFSVGLSRLMSDPDQRARLGRSASNHIKQWNPDHIHKIWYDLSSNVVNQ